MQRTCMKYNVFEEYHPTKKDRKTTQNYEAYVL